jgi:hypothetical protein
MTTQGLTAAQKSKLAKMDEANKVVGIYKGALLIRRRNGEVVRLKQNGLWAPIGVGALKSLAPEECGMSNRISRSS